MVASAKVTLMPRFRFITDSGTCAEVYEPADGTIGTALVLLGFPATIGESALTRFLQGSGLTVVQPHYAGTYDSDGLFTPESAIATVADIAEALSRGTVVDIKRMTSRSVPGPARVCVGYSFGAHVACHSLVSLATTTELVLLAPAVTYGDDNTGFSTEDLSFMDYVARSRPHTYRLGERTEWAELFGGRHNDFDPSHGQLRSVHAFVGELDESINATQLRAGLPRIIGRIAPAAVTETHTVEGAGHSSTALLTPDTKSVLARLLE